MNTNQNTEVTSSRKVGRPINPNATREIFLRKTKDAAGNEVLTPLGKGRRGSGNFVKVVVHRSIDSSNYIHGQTPIVGEPVNVSVEPQASEQKSNPVSVTVHISEEKTEIPITQQSQSVSSAESENPIPASA